MEDVTGKPVAQLVDELMGRRPELRFAFIQENAAFMREELDV
jgi:topoisomerase-4 subunit B